MIILIIINRDLTLLLFWRLSNNDDNTNHDMAYSWYLIYPGGWYIWIMISHSVDIWYPGGWYEPQQLAVAVSSLVRNSCFANKYNTNTNTATANNYNTNTNTTCLMKMVQLYKNEKVMNLTEIVLTLPLTRS